MATSGSHRDQVTVVTGQTCERCYKNNTTWTCKDCDMLMCDDCKNLHLKSKTSRKHEIVSLHRYEKWQISYGSKKNKCSKHPEEYVNMYCRHCDLLICSDCLCKDEHKSHKLSKLDQIALEKENDLLQIKEELTQKLSFCNDDINILENFQVYYSEHIDRQTNSMDERNVEIKMKSDRTTEGLKLHLQERVRNDEEIMKSERDRLVPIQRNLQELIKHCDTKQKSGEAEYIHFVSDIKQNLVQFKSYHPPQLPNLPIFVRRTNELDFEGLLGDLDLEPKTKAVKRNTSTFYTITPRIEVKIQHSFTTYASPRMVAATNYNKAWLYMQLGFGSGILVLTTSNGKRIKTIRNDILLSDMASSRSGNLFVFPHQEDSSKRHIVQELHPNGKSKEIYRTQDECIIQAITATSAKIIIVYLYAEVLDEDRIIKLSSSGKMIDTVYTENCIKEVELCPSKGICCNNVNGDIVVIGLGNRINTVEFLDAQGKKRFKYDGIGNQDLFVPVKAVSDKHGHVFISDYGSSLVHALDKDGNFLRFILQSAHGLRQIEGLSIDTSGRLWVCSSGNNRVMIVEYWKNDVVDY